jgi:hypothetical protein
MPIIEPLRFDFLIFFLNRRGISYWVFIENKGYLQKQTKGTGKKTKRKKYTKALSHDSIKGK